MDTDNSKVDKIFDYIPTSESFLFQPSTTTTINETTRSTSSPLSPLLSPSTTIPSASTTFPFTTTSSSLSSFSSTSMNTEKLAHDIFSILQCSKTNPFYQHQSISSLTTSSFSSLHSSIPQSSINDFNTLYLKQLSDNIINQTMNSSCSLVNSSSFSKLIPSPLELSTFMNSLVNFNSLIGSTFQLNNPKTFSTSTNCDNTTVPSTSLSWVPHTSSSMLSSNFTKFQNTLVEQQYKLNNCNSIIVNHSNYNNNDNLVPVRNADTNVITDNLMASV
ncbi:unnamed protein product [Heterobilharzia americana]|nr:unnamed protein product [Heterobilharzia americana]